MKFILSISWLTLTLLFNVPLMAAEQGHEHGHKHGGSEDSGVVRLTPEQISQINLETTTLKPQPRPETIRAPGIVAFNAYRLADVTSLVDGIVHTRHVRLGDKVRKGQLLVTLKSATLAQAEADYLRAQAEHRRSKQAWKRLEGLAKQKIVSQARLQQAESTHQAAHANLAAARAALSSYGLSWKEIRGLLNEREYGLLRLRAPSAGTIVADHFRVGQHLAAGSRLLQIADEDPVWVEVKIPESQLPLIRVGQSASVTIKEGRRSYSGKVINIHHQLDQATRTAGVRLEIENPEDVLHPGMFVQAEIVTGKGEPELLLPERAVQHQGGELIVFVEEEPGHFERREVRVGQASMGLVPVLEGVKAGERVVVKGAFTLLSELAKAGFEAHQH
jgi:RND family efflux transporter MFP subunit